MARPLSRQVLAEHLLRTIARDHLDGRRSDLESLTRLLGVRRADVRSTLTALHQEGYVDVLRMRLTLEGFALGVALLERPAPALRRDRKSLAA